MSLSVPGIVEIFSNSVAFRDLFSLLCFNVMDCCILNTGQNNPIFLNQQRGLKYINIYMHDPPKGYILYMNDYPISPYPTGYIHTGY